MWRCWTLRPAWFVSIASQVVRAEDLLGGEMPGGKGCSRELSIECGME